MRRALGFVLALSSFVSGAHIASAAPETRDAAAAEALFQRGVALMKKDDWVEACKAFDASMKLDPSVGTQINVARCSEHDGHIAAAWADYKKAKALNAETPLEKRKANVDAFVDAAIKKLEPRLPYVTITLVAHGPKGNLIEPSQISDLVVERDDTRIPVEGLGVSVPLDPGPHVFVAKAARYKPARVLTSFDEAEKKEIKLEITFDPSEEAPAEPVRPVGTTPDTRTPEAHHGPSPLLVTGITLGAVGGGLLVASAVTGGLAIGDRHDLDALVKSHACTEANGTIRCVPASQAAAHSAISGGKTLSTVSTITLFSGAAIGATGVVMAVVAATSKPKTPPRVGVVPFIGPGGVGAAIGGVFQ